MVRLIREWFGTLIIRLGVRVHAGEPVYTWHLQVQTEAHAALACEQNKRGEDGLRQLLAQASSDRWRQQSLHVDAGLELPSLSGHKPPDGMN